MDGLDFIQIRGALTQLDLFLNDMDHHQSTHLVRPMQRNIGHSVRVFLDSCTGRSGNPIPTLLYNRIAPIPLQPQQTPNTQLLLASFSPCNFNCVSSLSHVSLF
ncbi:hypothetical protein AAC387_Pa10g1930 [Persea americana]